MAATALKETYCWACSENFPKRPTHNNPPPRRRKLKLIKKSKDRQEFFCQGCGLTIAFTPKKDDG